MRFQTVPFRAIQRNEFQNRENEFAYIKRLVSQDGDALNNVVLIEGPRGIGKSELLKQLYNELFWGDEKVVPFYYCFQRATLKGAHFAKDYSTRFVRQFLASLKQDPSIVSDTATPVTRLLSIASSLSQGYLSDLVLYFQEQTREDALPDRVLAAIHAPLTTASMSGRRIVIMLDDFHLASEVYEAVPGDTPGVVSLFEDSMRSPSCPHIVTGSPPEALEAIFADDSLKGAADRVFLGPLYENDSFALFKERCSRLKLEVDEECRVLMRHLCGNPLYINNTASAIWKARWKSATPEVFKECYAYDVLRGNTAFYWSSTIKGCLKEPRLKDLLLRVLARSLDHPYDTADLRKLSMHFNVPEASVSAALEALRLSGMARVEGEIVLEGDTVMGDFIYGANMLEIERKPPGDVRDMIIARRFGPKDQGAVHFEMVIPMISEAELVAVKAVEQICSRVNLEHESVAEVQQAIIEACINAMEHSGSYEKKVFLKCTVYEGRLEVSVESRGKAFDPKALAHKHDGRNRGRGLEIMNKLMDEVRIEHVDDITRVVLVKHI